MKSIPCTFVLAGVCLALTFTSLRATPLCSKTSIHSLPASGCFPKDEIAHRLLRMDSPVHFTTFDEVEPYLRRYLTYGKKDAEEMLGTASVYYPVFELYLKKYHLPDQLKFMPIMESSLRPQAVSTQGAAGLWQLMPLAARSHGLVIDKYLDERKDPCKSTEAAVKYLLALKKRFGSWDLAMIAYNCGPSTVARAINASKGKNFKSIKNSLPGEARNYLSRYLAACYLGTYFSLHDLSPTLPDPMLAAGMSAKVFKAISLAKVSKLTGVEVLTLKLLNPAYRQHHVPAQTAGVYLTLPRWAWNAYLKDQTDRKGLAENRP